MPSPQPIESSGEVNASPTKRFFIAVLIKDIQMIDAIVELVDNSVDGAKAASPNGDLHGKRIEVSFDSTHFSITDNASGITIAQAENYAFRFGRVVGAPETPGSVGEFGVGMKRALFKLGRLFTVESTTDTEHFRVEVDVDAWQVEEESPSEWRFPMTVRRAKAISDNPGTTIRVERLYQYAVDELSSVAFGTRLMAVLRQAHEAAIAKGLQITVGVTSLQAQISKLLQSAEIQPISITENLQIDGKEVKVHLLAGLGERVLAEAGWYIYCNGRQIERAEQSERTGWQTAIIEGERKAPKAHWQFARFRGYLLFESSSPDVLPWNTTKTGLDIEAPAYRRVRIMMSTAMREVIDFLNELDQEGNDGAIDSAIRSAASTALMQIRQSPHFVHQQRAASTAGAPRAIRVSFDCDATRYEEVRVAIGATGRKQVGELLFEYFRSAEGLDG